MPRHTSHEGDYGSARRGVLWGGFVGEIRIRWWGEFVGEIGIRRWGEFVGEIRIRR